MKFRFYTFAGTLACLMFAGGAVAVPPPIIPPAGYSARMVCAMISREAKRRALPEVFFARLIWKESLFDTQAVSPKGAQGIAQFMPGTAKDRGLEDPFHPAQALPASAHLLADLRDQFGNVGLAAAAYNAGEDRVRAWLDGRANLPAETLGYVLFITGRPADDWAQGPARVSMAALGQDGDFMANCIKLASRQAPPLTGAILAGEWKPWGVQVAAARSESIALAGWSRVQARHSGLLTGVKPLIIRKRNPAMGRGRVVNVRIGAQTRAEAEQLCGKLRRAGGACLIARN